MSEERKIWATEGWMCKVDFDYELGASLGGNKIYSSEKDCRRHRPYVEECGVTHVVTLSKEDFDLSHG